MEGVTVIFVDRLADLKAYQRLVYQQIRKDLPAQISLTEWENLIDRRLKMGSVQISAVTVMPHVEVKGLKQSRVHLIRLREPLYWEESCTTIHLILTLLIKPGEEDEGRKMVLQLVTCFAGEDFEAGVLACETEEELERFLERSVENGVVPNKWESGH